MEKYLKNYLNKKINRARELRKKAVEPDELEFYRAKIISYKNVYKEIEEQQLLIHGVTHS